MKYSISATFFILVILSQLLPKPLQFPYLYFATTLGFVSIIFQIILMLNANKKSVINIGSNLAAISFKNFLSIAVMLCYFYFWKQKENTDILICFSIYLIYSFVSYYYAFTLKNNFYEKK